MMQYLCFSHCTIVSGSSCWRKFIVDLPVNSSFSLGFSSFGLFFSDLDFDCNNGSIRWSDCDDWHCCVESDVSVSVPFWDDAVHFSLATFLKSFNLCFSLFYPRDDVYGDDYE